MKDWKIEKELRRKIWTTKTNYSDSVTRFGEFFPLWQTFEGSLRVWQIFTYILVPTFIAENAQRLKRIWPYGHTELVLYKSFTIELLVRASGDGGWALLPLYDILPYPPISISGSGFRSMGDLGWLWPDIFDGDGSEIRNIWKHLIPHQNQTSEVGLNIAFGLGTSCCSRKIRVEDLSAVVWSDPSKRHYGGCGDYKNVEKPCKK